MKAWCILALALAAVPAKADDITRIVGRWDRCFFASTRSQFNANILAEPNMVAEIAFEACRTEEQSLEAFLALNSVLPATAISIILRHRSALKAKITG
jgi:hypothetical protein